MASFSQPNQTKRLFIGIQPALNNTLLESYQQIKTKLSASSIKWTEINNLHLTLLFLGDTQQSDIVKIKKILLETAASTEAFPLTFKGFGHFGKSHPKVLWIGIEASKSLELVSKKINGGLAELQIAKDEKAFNPHITIGRIKQLRNKDEIVEITESYKCEKFQTAAIGEIILFESILKPAGPEYLVLERFRLK